MWSSQKILEMIGQAAVVVIFCFWWWSILFINRIRNPSAVDGAKPSSRNLTILTIYITIVTFLAGILLGGHVSDFGFDDVNYDESSYQ